MIEIVSAALPLILNLLGWILKKSNASASTIQAYYNFTAAIESDSNASAKLRASAKAQRERLKDEWNKETPQ